MPHRQPQEIISANIVMSRLALSLGGIFSLIYITWWFDLNNLGNPILYILLVIGEIFHVWQALGYIYTVWDQRVVKPVAIKEFYPVDILITVYNEPQEVIEETLKAMAQLDYPSYKVYLLNDGFNAKRPDWEEVNSLAERYGAIPITRRKSNGAKAGNINNALKTVNSPFFAVFDVDHIPSKDFLKETMGYFSDDRMALVQTPQYYGNREDNLLTRASWEQQELFFGPICKGKNRMNATFWCGTNAVIRRAAIEDAGGIPEDNIAEDFLASLFMHERGWKSVYVAKVLATGMAPHDLASFCTQQYRWARGSLEIIFKYNPLFRKGLSWGQKVQYLYSSSFYLNGVIVLIDALIPIIALNFDVLPVVDSTGNFMVYFFPFIFSTVYILMQSTDHTITFRAIQLSVASFYIHISATIATILGKEAKFKVTSKSREEGNYLRLAIPHLLYIVVSIFSVLNGIYHKGLIPSVVTNVAWVVFNSVFFFGFVRVAYPWRKLSASVYEFFNAPLADATLVVPQVVESTKKGAL